MQITRFGHSAILVENAGTAILVDPGGFSPDETFQLEGLDAIIVTHQHLDHLDRTRAPELIDRNRDAVLLCDPETASIVDFGAWIPHADGVETIVGSVTVRGVGSQHAVIVPELPRVSNVGVELTAGGTTVFHPGDTYQYAPDGVDVLALPLAAPWGKISETVEFVQRVSPATVFPIHDCTIAEAAYGIYWQHVATFGGVDDLHKLGQRDSLDV